MPTLPSREVRLKSRPVGLPTVDNFEIGTSPAPEPKDGEIQVRNTWMSVDPYMRARMIDRKSYIPPFQIGEVLQGGAIGEVVASADPGFAPGDLVLSMAGWREAWTAPPAAALAQKLSTFGLPPQTFLGIAGMPGLTAYAGLLEVGRPKSGETVLVSGAAGAVGSLVCQIAKIKGCRVIGSAGGPEKVAFLDSIGCDAAIDYKQHTGVGGLTRAFQAAAPKGVDVYFENVGGDHLAAAFNVMNNFGRVAVCGMISGYNDAEPTPGPANMFHIIAKRLRVEGFIVMDYVNLTHTFLTELSGWVRDGRVRREETIRTGIDAAPGAFLELFSGGNIGKMLVKLA